MQSAVNVFKCLADETRLKMLLMLQTDGELCVCELEEALEISQPKASRQLALLKQHNIVTERQNDLWLFYRLNPDLPEWIADVIRTSQRGLRQEMNNFYNKANAQNKIFTSCE